MRDGLRYRGKWFKKEVWFSFCSAHYHYDKDCRLCNSGTWNNVIAYKIGRIVYWISPRFWRWWVNR